MRPLVMMVSTMMLGLLVAGLFGPAPAAAQALNGQTMTMQQAENLSAALLLIDRGSVDQCPVGKAAKEPDPKAPAADRVCPFHKSTALLKAMAQDMVALKPIDDKFRIEQNTVQKQVFAELPIPTGATDIGMKAVEGQHNIRFVELMRPINEEPVTVLGQIAPIKMSDLDLGDAPDHNSIPAEVIAALSVVMPDFGFGAAPTK